MYLRRVVQGRGLPVVSARFVCRGRQPPGCASQLSTAATKQPRHTPNEIPLIVGCSAPWSQLLPAAFVGSQALENVAPKVTGRLTLLAYADVTRHIGYSRLTEN